MIKKTVYPFILLVVLSACSQKKNTLVNRSFHNLTAHYNGYFWARENIKEGLAKIERAHVDDYSTIIPLFVYGDEKLVQANIVHFNKAIEKTSHVINYHSMLIKGVEYCKWIDENYLVLGQGHFYKKDYFSALEVFEYILKQYPNSSTRYNALLWLIKTYNAQLRVLNTQATIDLIANDKKFPAKLIGEFSALQAEFYIMTKNYEKAIFNLNKAIASESNKRHKARYIFVLAQLHELKGDNKKASQYYAQCAKLNPPYEMFFNARIKRALIVQGKDSKEIKKELSKMIKDAKNKEYRDQLYYALADMSIRAGDTTQGLALLKQSAASSMQNTKQRGITYERFADIYFNKNNYPLAQAYYDSASTFLPKDYVTYENVLNKKNSLSGLVKNINTIQREDSLLKLSALDTSKLYSMIDKIIAKVIEEEKKKEEDKLNNVNGPNFTNNVNNNNATNNNSGGTWYFYNPSSLGFGLSDFLKKWGPRQLEDNWRRSIKESEITEQEETLVSNTSDTSKKDTKVSDNKKRDYYLNNLPFTDEAKQKSTLKIIEAYNNLGGIYREQLKNYPMCIETFETLNKRFPDNKYLLQNYYQLYRVCLLIKENKKAEYYKQQILTKYPDSEYSNIIKNPDYIKNKNAAEDLVEAFYDKAYEQYVAGNNTRVIAMCNEADSNFRGSELLPKFALLKAYSIGKTASVKDYENALTAIIIKYPKDPAKNKAQEILDHLKKINSKPDSLSSSETQVNIINAPLFTFNADTVHYCMLFTPNKGFNMAQFKINLSDFNTKNFSTDNISVFNLLYGMEYQLITVREFPNLKKAMHYYTTLMTDSTVFKDFNISEIEAVLITPSNYAVFYKEKKKTEYQNFFLENYGK